MSKARKPHNVWHVWVLLYIMSTLKKIWNYNLKANYNKQATQNSLMKYLTESSNIRKLHSCYTKVKLIMWNLHFYLLAIVFVSPLHILSPPIGPLVNYTYQWYYSEICQFDDTFIKFVHYDFISAITISEKTKGFVFQVENYWLFKTF